MRIVGGDFRGRKLNAPKGDNTRPTTDRNRETLFNILSHSEHVDLQGARALDLFAGSGALGFEAMSRGAAWALFVEMETAARGAIRENMHALGVQGKSKIFRRDATKLGNIGTMAPFNLVFADPPYGKGLGEYALQSLVDGGWLMEENLIVLEEAASSAFMLPSSFKLIEERNLGESVLRFITKP